MAAPPATRHDLLLPPEAPAPALAAWPPGYGLDDRLLLNAGRVLMLLGALLLMWQPPAAVTAPLDAGRRLFFATALLLWLLGATAAPLSLAGRRRVIPRLAAAGAVTAAVALLSATVACRGL